MLTIKVKDNQSIIDLAKQHCGSDEAAFDLAELNGLSITDKPIPGQILQLPDVANKDIAKYYSDRGIVPATAFNLNLEGSFENNFDFSFVKNI